MALLNREVEYFQESRKLDASKKLVSFINEEEMMGDLLSLDYAEATVLVHDSLRKTVGGLPLGCFLIATRIGASETPDPADEDTSLILLRVIGQSALPNKSDTESWKFDAALRSIDSGDQWDADSKSDQFTKNLLRHAGVRCSVLGTFRYIEQDKRWNLQFGADISNFYSGQGMKIYKPMGTALKEIVNFTKPMGTSHPLAGRPVKIGRVRYASSEIAIDVSRENVPVVIEPTDMVARRTALFGMSRSGKSNTIKTLASALFKLREFDAEKGKVGQLIFDVNGEYCNDNPQDEGCLRNISDDVVTYGLFKHPNDEKRRLIKINFFGENVQDWADPDAVVASLSMLYAGKSVIDDHLREQSEAQYVRNFVTTSLEQSFLEWTRGDQTRYKRNISVYRAILHGAGFESPGSMNRVRIKGMFNDQLRNAMHAIGESEFTRAATTFGEDSVTWNDYFSAIRTLYDFMLGSKIDRYNQFNDSYRQDHRDNKDWHDDTLKGLLSILQYPGGVNKVRELKTRHNPDVESDYSTEIVDVLVQGKLVIIDQSIGSPDEIRISAERIMWELFNRQKEVFTNPKRDSSGELIRDESGNIALPHDVIVFVEEAHNLLPARNEDLTSIWARIAKEGSKFRIGLVYSTQEPSSILSNILKNTDNWFVAHLNNQDEIRELRKYYDFVLFADQILKVPDTGFVRMRCLSNPYIVPVQIDKFVADPPSAGSPWEDSDD